MIVSPVCTGLDTVSNADSFSSLKTLESSLIAMFSYGSAIDNPHYIDLSLAIAAAKSDSCRVLHKEAKKRLMSAAFMSLYRH